MSKKKSSEHLVSWAENEHLTKPAETGCIWRHADYGHRTFTRCDYCKNAHDYSKASEGHIYNVPNMRSPERWVRIWVEDLKEHVWKHAGTTEPKSKAVDPANSAWHLDKGSNFTDSKTPWWNNTHHAIACGELKDAFPQESEQRLIVKMKWNINMMPNVIILPKQYVVARILKLPTHVPPDGAANHDKYSAKLGNGLNGMKGKLKQNADTTGHEVTDENVPDCVGELNRIAKELRDYLIETGERNPGVNLDNLSLDKVNF